MAELPIKSRLKKLILQVDNSTRDLVGIKMVINDWFVSPVFQAEYNPTSGIDNLPIEITGDNLSISVAIQNEKVIKGMRLYNTSDTN